MSGKKGKKRPVHSQKNRITQEKELFERLFPRFVNEPIGTFVAISPKTEKIIISKKRDILDFFPFLEQLLREDASQQPFWVMRLWKGPQGEKCIVPPISLSTAGRRK